MTSMQLARWAPTLPFLFATGMAHAHPGHDTAPAFSLLEGLVHMLTQPDHLLMLAGAAGFAVAAIRGWRLHRVSARR